MLPTRSWLNTPIQRRTLLAAGASVALAGALARPAGASPVELMPFIHPRDDWAAGLQPVGPLEVEEPGDVRFLLVHHSASPNTDAPDQIPGRIRSFFDYHTQTKGWADVAYNFFIDPYGGLWEGRQGSLVSPVKGDATGGSQGYALLCCFIGDFSAVEPTPQAMDAAARLLAWLAATYQIDLSPGSQVQFTSRGSTLWPVAAEVVTDPIAGHRDMSQTTCPGEALYPLVRGQLWPAARELVTPPQPSPEPDDTPEPTEPETPSVTPVPAPSSSITPVETPLPQPVDSTPPSGAPTWLLPAGLGAAAASAAAAAWAIRSRQPQPPAQPLT